jgi:hypothetical protein
MDTIVGKQSAQAAMLDCTAQAPRTAAKAEAGKSVDAHCV